MARWLVRVAPGAIFLALVLWGIGLSSVDVRRMNDFGLVSVLPVWLKKLPGCL